VEGRTKLYSGRGNCNIANGLMYLNEYFVTKKNASGPWALYVLPHRLDRQVLSVL
jgi:hypothetical protein